MGDTEPPDPWEINIRNNVTKTNEKGQNNSISTTKYSALSFLPLSVMLQFKRIANVYFLVISIMMIIGMLMPELYDSPLDPYSTIIPLCIVLSITCVKEGMEDMQRAKFDHEDNVRPVIVVRFSEKGEAKEFSIATKDVKAGDVVKLEAGTDPMQVPVDMVVILTSNHDDGNQCYIETANIDGETNLKVRQGPTEIKQLIKSDGSDQVEHFFQGKLEVEPPNEDIHHFVGALHLENTNIGKIPLNEDNLLLRSSVFTNTEFAYGIAVYTGQETKVMMNNRLVASKMSTIEKLANTAIFIVFLTQVVVVSGVVACIYLLGFEDRSFYTYVYPDGNGNSILPVWLESWFIFFILFNNMIPISLYVTLELVNVGQAWLIGSDQELYDETLDTPCLVKSSNMCQELGMVSNVFSDKTGTLTCNEMKFVKFLIDGKSFDVYTKPETAKKSTLGTLGGGSALGSGRGTSHTMSDNSLVTFLKSRNGQKSKEMNFMRCLTTCHTVVREKNGSYRAESPDELALVEGVANFKCYLRERDMTSMKCEVAGVLCDYKILAVNHFNSARKRMSILVQEMSSGQHYVMCKGADSAMLSLCHLPPNEMKNVEKALLDIACMGLRTLCVAHRKISTAEVKKWLAKHKAAASSLTNRGDRLDRVAQELEGDLELLGITAIEDKLQDQVPEVIADLAKAGIVLWMLTGDKEETAIQIGQSCNLVTPNTKLFFLTKITNKEHYAVKLRDVWNVISGGWVDNRGFVDKDHPLGAEVVLVMDGPSFIHFDEKDEDQRQLLLQIGTKCRSVVACRLMPKQKQLVVSIVKTDTVPKAITLAIGDGANDVSMIREADVGIGILGKEGKQAANNADMAIGQFKFLRRLMLVHGRWNYVRSSKTFLYSMHKNLVISFTLVWFSFLAGLSGTSPYESYIYTGYNFALTLPIIFFGIMDKDIDGKFAERNPQTYATGKDNTELCTSTILQWIVNAVMYAVAICTMSYIVHKDTFKSYSLYGAGTVIYLGLLQAMQFKVAFLHHQWNYLSVLAMFLSLAGTMAVLYMLNTLIWMSPEFYNVFMHLSEEVPLIFYVVGAGYTPLVCGLIDFIGHSMYVFFWPKPVMLYREAQLAEEKAAISMEGSGGSPRKRYAPDSAKKLRMEVDMELATRV
jgi:phospholipid-transporting ATPase